MGTVFRKKVTRQVPNNAEIVTRKGKHCARWKGRNGRFKTAPLTLTKDREQRILDTAATYTARYRDGQGIVREVSTGCRDADAARAVLARLEQRAEKVRSGILTVAEDAAIDHQATPLTEHFEEYHEHRRALGLNAVRIRNTEARLERLAEECGFSSLKCLRGESLESWLAARKREGMSPGTRNEYRQELVGFGNWCVSTSRLTENPFSKVARADARSDQRRKRRAMSEPELQRLLYVAEMRPIAEHGRIKERKKGKGAHDTWKLSALDFESFPGAVERGKEALKGKPALLAKLQRRGRERALIYKTLVLTGLRRGELASITLGQVQLDGDIPHLVLDAKNAKNREGAELPLRADLVADLRKWIEEKPGNESHTALFDVPSSLLRVLNRDL